MSGILMMSVGNSYGYKPINTVAPAVTGTASVGQTLSCSTGTWDAAPPVTSYAYQWLRSGSPISGATSSTYTLVSADAGATISCTVTATNAVGVTSATSNSTTAVTQAPVNTVAPVVSGTAQVAQTLSCSTGTWTGTPASFTYAYQWQRNTSNISGATSSTYVIQSADVGNTLRCVVTATNTAGSTSANSNSTATVTEVTGQIAFTSPGTYTWVVPVGVTSISAVAVHAGAGGGISNGGGGGNLGYTNGLVVTPGETFTALVPAGGAGNTSSGNIPTNLRLYRGTNPDNVAIFLFYSSISKPWLGADGVVFSGTRTSTGHGIGGNSQNTGSYHTGGGGAGGYGGAGGAGGYGGAGATGSNGGGGGGGGGSYYDDYYPPCYSIPGGNALSSGAGGGVGILGQGANGTGGSYASGSAGGNGNPGSGGSGQTFGGGGRSGSAIAYPTYCCSNPIGYTFNPGTSGGSGAIRIIWPGTTRQFPSTNTGNL